MHIFQTKLNSWEINSENLHESLILIISYKRPPNIFLIHPIYSQDDFYDLPYSLLTHPQPLFMHQCKQLLSKTNLSDNVPN